MQTPDPAEARPEPLRTPIPIFDATQAERFVRAMLPNGLPERLLLEVRLLHHDGEGAIQKYGRDARWDALAHAHDEGWNIFLGPGLRSREGGTKADVGALAALWADVDAKRFGGDKREAVRAIFGLPPELHPSALVDSGHGIHAWWWLTEPIHVTEESRERLEAILRGLQQAVGSDPVHDLSRVMRLPGSVNVKDPTRPRPCRFVSLSVERRFTLDAFARFCDVTPAAQTARAPGPTTLPAVKLDDLRVRDEIKLLIQTGRTEGGKYPSRSEADQAVVTALREAGHSPDEVKAVFANPEWAIRAKYREEGDRYLERSIAAADAFLEQAKKARSNGQEGESSTSGGPGTNVPALWVELVQKGVIPIEGCHTPEDRAKVLALVEKNAPTIPQRTRDALAPVLAAEQERANEFTFCEEVMAVDLPPVEWAVKPLIVRGNRVMLFGAFGTLKSWLLLDLAIHLAAGREWLGFSVPRPLSVLYIDEEVSERSLRRRQKRLMAGAGITGPLPLALRSGKGGKLDEAGAKRLLDLLDRYRLAPDVVIVETLRRVLVGSENSAEDVGRFWDAIKPIWRREITLIVSHHTKKPPAEGGNLRDQASGSTDLLAGPDAGFGVRRGGEKDNVVVVCVKQREDELADAFGVRLDAPDREGPARLVLANVTATLSPAVRKALDLIEAFVKANPAATRDTIKDHLEAKGVSRPTMYRALDVAKGDTVEGEE